jgi:E3 ubiquitin-protein ligase NEDD4
MANKPQPPPKTTQDTHSSGLTTSANDPQEAYGNADPVRDSANPLAPLSPHWEELVSSDGTTYYANHATRSTTWTRPGAEEEGVDGANIKASLPAGWQAMADSEGRTYYANHESRTTTFDRPEGPTGELPAGWEMLRTPQGVAYFADHNTHTATWHDPRSA